MRLYLVQHAEAKNKEEAAERPLSEGGRKDTEKVAEHLGEHADVRVAEIRHSGKLRAEQTAGALAQALSLTRGVSQADGLGPTDDPAIWAHRLGEAQENTILVGHLPHLSRLAGRLLCGDEEGEPVKFANAGVACLVRSEEGNWSVEWLIIPELT